MTIYELPSLIALIFKGLLLFYIARAGVRTRLGLLFAGLLLVLSLFNAVEFVGLHLLASQGFSAISETLGFIYVALLIPAIALILHISLVLSQSGGDGDDRRYWLAYVPAVVLEFLLLATDRLIVGFAPFQHSVLREPGSWYFLFETYVFVYLLAALVNVALGARPGRTPALARIRCQFWLLAVAPIGLLLGYLIVANHFGLAKITSTFYLPILMTFFLAVTTYATHQYRLFDVEFYIPGSKVRRRKTAFYDRIRAMIAEIADLDSVQTALDRVGATLRCPVALVGTRQEAMTLAPTDAAFSRIPRAALEGIDHIVVAHEVAQAMPELYRTMREHGVAAIVPFHPHSQYAAGWLILGDGFNNEVYTPRDFKLVEELFAKMGDLFLDKLLAMRAQLAEAVREVRRLEQRAADALNRIEQLKGESAHLARENQRLLALQPADSVALEPAAPRAITLAVLGRNKTLAKELRQYFAQTEHYVGADSQSFKRKPLPDVMVYYLESAHDNAALELASTLPAQHAVLLTGPGAGPFAEQHKATLSGRLIEVVAHDGDTAIVARKAEALAALARSTVLLADAQRVLIGNSGGFQRALTEARRLAALPDAVLVRGDDVDFAHAVSVLMHRLSGARGAFYRVDANAVAADTDKGAIEQWVAQASQGTLFVAGLAEMFRETADHLLHVSAAASVRVIAYDSTGTLNVSSMAPHRPFELDLPALRERRDDAQLLAHYFTLQFNLQACTARYLRQQEFDALLATAEPTMAGLRHAIAGALIEEKTAAAPAEIDFAALDKTLDEYLAQFEAKVLAQTLERCQGNKSKAARLLGLKPNTLHYKLERYGLAIAKPRIATRDT